MVVPRVSCGDLRGMPGLVGILMFSRYEAEKTRFMVKMELRPVTA
jgi:hypothetical protein